MMTRKRDLAGAGAHRDGETARCILDRLAIAFRRALLAAQSLSARRADLVASSAEALVSCLCQLTADATGLRQLLWPGIGAGLRA